MIWGTLGVVIGLLLVVFMIQLRLTTQNYKWALLGLVTAAMLISFAGHTRQFTNILPKRPEQINSNGEPRPIVDAQNIPVEPPPVEEVPVESNTARETPVELDSPRETPLELVPADRNMHLDNYTTYPKHAVSPEDIPQEVKPQALSRAC
jgi:hypothetical protein